MLRDHASLACASRSGFRRADGHAPGAGAICWEEVRALAVRVARRRLHDPAAAEEVAQDALLRLWRARARLAAAESQEAWIVRVVSNEVLRHVEQRDRRQAREATVEDHAVRMAAPAPSLPVEDGIWVRQGVATLEGLDRQIVELHYFDDVPLPSVASAVGMPLGSVKARVHRARKKLAAELAA